MAEQVDLTTPQVATATTYTLNYLGINPVAGTIIVEIKSNLGTLITKVYDSTTTPTGAALLSSLNTSNNSAGTSLIKRVFSRLVSDGVIVGTVSGVAV
jgi:uncharacterized protein (DUF111 family)